MGDRAPGGRPVASLFVLFALLGSPSLALAQSAAPAAASAASDTPPPPAEPPVAEVTVHGVRSDPGRQELSGGEVRQMPGAFGDAFRAIEALPGVIPLVSGLPYFLVRGAPPGDTGFFIDGVRVPALFHLGVGAAVIHPGLIDRVDLYPGGYPARFGRFTGGILTGETLPTPERPHAEASLRLLDAGALASTPVGDGRGDVLVSGRYGYPGPLLSLFAPDVGLAYWDYQTRAQWRPTDRDQLGAFVFGSYDSLSSRDTFTGRTTQLLGVQFHRADLRWDRRTSAEGTLRVALTLGYDRTAAGDSSQLGTTSFVESGLFGLRGEWSDRAARDLELRVGADAILQPYRIAVPSGGPANGIAMPTLGVGSAEFLQDDFDTGAFVEAVWHPTDRVEIRPGARVDLFTSSYPGGEGSSGGVVGFGGPPRAVPTLDPRLATRWQITRDVAWISALGIAHQASNVPLPSPGLQFSQLSRGVQAAYQMAEGAEVELPAGFTATGNLFLHDYTGLVDFYESCPAGHSPCSFAGRAVGAELLVRRALTARFTGWVSYTLSRVERDSFYGGQWIRRLSEFDRTHVVNVVAAANLGARWRAGARLVAYSGLPYSSYVQSGPPDSRGPPFVRLDLRLEKRWQALGGTMAFVLEWLNALLNKEAVGTSCTYSDYGTTAPSAQCQPTLVGPITFPSVGLEASW